MKKITTLVLILIVSGTVYAQDLIIKKNGEEIKSKVLEVSLKNIRYKKYDNLNGPIFEILKSDVFIIKYENGTRDVINPISEKAPTKTAEIGDEDTDTPSTQAFTDKHRSTTIAYGASAIFGGITSFSNGSREKGTAIGPVVVSFDKALSKKFSIAFRPAVMYYSWKSWDSYSGSYKFNSFFGGVQVRVDYHFATTTKIDPYFGLSGGVGYFFNSDNLTSGIDKGAYPLSGGGFGIKIYGKKKNALLVELGYDSYSYLKVGYVFGKKK